MSVQGCIQKFIEGGGGVDFFVWTEKWGRGLWEFFPYNP